MYSTECIYPQEQLIARHHRSTLWMRRAAPPVLSRFTSSSTCRPISLIIPALVIHHSFTLSLEAQSLPFQRILPTLDFLYLLDCLMITEPITLMILVLVSHFIFCLFRVVD